ncbi:MAG: serine/threonine-protein kinase [Deltaproteobacteria bacterium]|nr:serine/threonine-protein kinase [Deltaproteobacteria bacterium]
MVDVAEAEQMLDATLKAAFEAAREYGADLNAVAVEELALWEKVGAVVVPAFTAACLQAAANAVDEPQLPALLASRDQTRTAQEDARAGFENAMLDPLELEELSTRRKRLDARLTADRGRYKEMRARPGLLNRVDEMKKGAKQKDDVAAAVRAYEELRINVEATETELTRLAAVAARHHRAKIRLTELDDQLAALDAGSLRDARCIVVDRLMKSSAGALKAFPSLGPIFRQIEGVGAKRAALNSIYESWLRPHGGALVEVQNQGIGISGFETVSWPPKVELRCRDATIAIDAYRRSAAGVVGFVDYEQVVTNARGERDWWSTLLPGVPNPDGSPVVVAAPRDIADVASDKLAAAWATIEPAGPDPFGEHTVDDGALHTAPPSIELLFGLPPSLSQLMKEMPSAPRPQPIPGFSSGFAEASREAPRPPPVVVADLTRPSFAPGSRVGRCVVDALIGRGGMGEVYRARLEGDIGFSRTVVLKRLSVDREADPTLAQAFAREAEIAARIAHPNVVQIFDVQSAGGEPFIVMELLEGLTLQKLVTRAEREKVQVDLPVIVRCAVDAARGLHAAHSMRSDDGVLVGLVHRDVSPDNLFLCQNGFTKLLDFGIARRNDLTTMTGKSELKGKIPYMSPEQIMGDPLDARSDLFSLGATLYWILSGQRPFTGDNEVTTLYAVVNKPHLPVRNLRPNAGAFGEVIEQLLQKRRDDRPPSALAVAQLLEKCGPATPEDAAAFLAKIWEA